MTPKRIVTTLGLAIVFALVANPGLAQTQPTPTSTPAASGDQAASASAMAQEATNPFSNSWLMQIQQNNNWTDMPGGDGHLLQSNYVFQPLISLRVTEEWALYVRPVLPMVDSVPYVDQDGRKQRITGFGDTVLGLAVPFELFGGRLTVGGGPTFVFPTSSRRGLGQDTWQIGPDVGATLLGKHFIAYAFVQQWFKFGGNGRETNQMSGVFNFTYSFKNGWVVGTQPNLSVDWKAPEDEGVALAIGPQVGKMCTCGGLPTLFQVQLQYYAVRPSVAPKWNIQLQVTPTVPALLKTLF